MRKLNKSWNPSKNQRNKRVKEIENNYICIIVHFYLII